MEVLLDSFVRLHLVGAVIQVRDVHFGHNFLFPGVVVLEPARCGNELPAPNLSFYSCSILL